MVAARMRRVPWQSSTLRYPTFWTLVPSLVLVGVVGVIAVVHGPLVGTYGYLWLVGLISLSALNLAETVRWGRRVKRATTLARSLEGGLCIHCLYPLPEFHQDGTCPECGKAYFVEENLNLWGITRTPKGRGGPPPSDAEPHG